MRRNNFTNAVELIECIMDGNNDENNRDFARRLMTITASCRPDMHEPDEQEISAHVVGDHLDNAFGDSIEGEAVLGRYQEYVVVLQSRGSYYKTEAFNLASLIALARVGAQAIIDRSEV